MLWFFFQFSCPPQIYASSDESSWCLEFCEAIDLIYCQQVLSVAVYNHYKRIYYESLAKWLDTHHMLSYAFIVITLFHFIINCKDPELYCVLELTSADKLCLSNINFYGLGLQEIQIMVKLMQVTVRLWSLRKATFL